LGKDVKFGYSDPRKTTSIWTYWEQGIREVLIPQTYSMSARTLAELLTALQKHFIRAASKDSFLDPQSVTSKVRSHSSA